MLFNSYIFILVFLPITLVVFFGLAQLGLINVAVIWMTLASLFFYGYWNPIYLPLLLISVLGNYGLGWKINQLQSKSFEAKVFLILGIIFNLVILGYYKYANFFVDSINQIFHTNLFIPEIILPLAISFYSFTQIAYLVDAYNGETKDANYDLVTYTLFVAFYPQLIAGPILRHQLIPEFRRFQHFVFSDKNFILGLTLFILGLSKKVLIADNLSPWVADVFGNASTVTFPEAWVGALSYTFQLYFDFSGYSDMAVGLGWMTNIDLPINFYSPYKAISISDFWRRWHITLSNFLRDYLYIPLGGSKLGQTRRYFNLMITMLLGGLWHGAGWTFVLWGGLHGFYLVVNHAWRRVGLVLPKKLGWLLTFMAVIFSWVLFRATTWQEGWEIIQAMIGMKGILIPITAKGPLVLLENLGINFQQWLAIPHLPRLGGPQTTLILLGLVLGVTILPNTQEMMEKFKPTVIWSLVIGTLATFCLISLNQVSEFLYFQF